MQTQFMSDVEQEKCSSSRVLERSVLEVLFTEDTLDVLHHAQLKKVLFEGEESTVFLFLNRLTRT